VDGIPLDRFDVAVAAAVIAILIAARWLRTHRMPPQKTFRCARCSAIEAHSQRTIEAWRSGKAKLFCCSCHAKWLQTQPFADRPSGRARSGCLGVFIFAVVAPAILWGAFYYAWRIA